MLRAPAAPGAATRSPPGRRAGARRRRPRRRQPPAPAPWRRRSPRRCSLPFKRARHQPILCACPALRSSASHGWRGLRDKIVAARSSVAGNREWFVGSWVVVTTRARRGIFSVLLLGPPREECGVPNCHPVHRPVRLPSTPRNTEERTPQRPVCQAYEAIPLLSLWKTSCKLRQASAPAQFPARARRCHWRPHVGLRRDADAWLAGWRWRWGRTLVHGAAHYSAV